MNWVLEHLQILIGAAAAIAYFLNRRRTEAAEAEQSTRNRDGSTEEQGERTRRVQEEIRRKIAERRGLTPPAIERRAPQEHVPPVMQPAPVSPLDPFGGPARRMLRRIEEAAATLEERIEDPEAAAKAAELARRAKLAEQLRDLEIARIEQERRAAAIVAARRKQTVAMALFPADPRSIQAALRDPQELRRAIVLRELLGPPVSLCSR